MTIPLIWSRQAALAHLSSEAGIAHLPPGQPPPWGPPTLRATQASVGNLVGSLGEATQCGPAAQLRGGAAVLVGDGTSGGVPLGSDPLGPPLMSIRAAGGHQFLFTESQLGVMLCDGVELFLSRFLF